MGTLTVIHVTRTGHAVAALTRAAPPPAAEPVIALAGAGLPLRVLGVAGPNQIDALTVPADLLAAVEIDRGSGVLDDPRAFRVVEVQRSGQRVMELQGFTDTAALALSATEATVTLTGVVTIAVVATSVAVVMEQPGTRIVREGVIPVGAGSVTLPAAVAPGEWKAVAFVTGRAPATLVQSL